MTPKYLQLRGFWSNLALQAQQVRYQAHRVDTSRTSDTSAPALSLRAGLAKLAGNLLRIAQRNQSARIRMAAYDTDNVFAKILRGEIPSMRVYEDDDTLCFMDIMPRSDGHCLVIPKTSCRNILDATDAQLAACMSTVKRVANAAKSALEADGVTLQQFSEAAGGQEVFHLHFHILPRHAGVSLRPPGQMGDMDHIAEIAAKISAKI